MKWVASNAAGRDPRRRDNGTVQDLLLDDLQRRLDFCKSQKHRRHHQEEAKL